jgi:hypothetical protein
MAKQGRMAEVLVFLRTAPVTPTSAEHFRLPVSEWLDEVPISAAVEQGMSQGKAGTETTRKYREAMILILCGLNQIPIARARQAVAQYQDTALPAALGTMLADVNKICIPKLLNPPLQQLSTGPAAFLANNRIKTGNGVMTTSDNSQYEFSWDWSYRYYLMEPPVAFHHNMHIKFPGYNIAVTKFSGIANPAHIDGALVQGNMGLTTQLSGCSILYSVNGAHLVVAHVWPNEAGPVRANLPPALATQAGLPPGVVLALRLAHQGDLSNPVAGGTFGIYGQVEDAAHTGQRLVGPRNIRTHGYVDTAGNAYFIAVQVAGSWQLFGQQNHPGKPAEGVSALQQIYP